MSPCRAFPGDSQSLRIKFSRNAVLHPILHLDSGMLQLDFYDSHTLDLYFSHTVPNVRKMRI